MKNFVEKEWKINENIRRKIKMADLPEPIKEFIIKILGIEFREGKGNYSRSYEIAVEEATVKIK